MNRIKYDSTLMGYLSIFENITKSQAKDCFVHGNMLMFITMPNEIAKAIGKGGQNAQRLERVLKKKVKIVEFDPNLGQFIRKLIYPLEVGEISEQQGGLVTIKGRDVATKSMLIGRNATALRGTEEIVKRYFNIKEIKVI